MKEHYKSLLEFKEIAKKDREFLKKVRGVKPRKTLDLKRRSGHNVKSYRKSRRIRIDIENEI